MGEGMHPADRVGAPAEDDSRAFAGPEGSPNRPTAGADVPDADAPSADVSAAPSASAGAPTPVTFRLGNRPSLTGIRSVGIAAVVIYHANFKTLPGAWSMLEMFFVLSGFLITTMLATEHQRTGGISLRNFYSRRAVRLLPPLFITIALIALYASVVNVFDAFHRILGDSAAALFYYADYRSALSTEPWGGFLAQCWSLAVEEQFYLVWAALFFVALRYGNRRLAYGIAIGGIVLSVADRTGIVLHAHTWSTALANRTYYAFDTRADALFLGCLLGLMATGGHLDDWSPRVMRALTGAAAVSAVVLVYILCFVSLGVRSLPLFWLPISEIGWAVLIVYLIVQPVGLATKLLSVPVVVLIGNMSYAIYLFHWPVYVAISPFTVSWGFWPMEVVRLAIIASLAVASWYLVEQRLMVWRRRRLDPTHPVATGPPAPAAGREPTGIAPLGPVATADAAPADIAPAVE